jgi:hypothetical protein
MMIDSWIDHAERCLFVVAHQLKRVPLQPSTRRLHLRALELKRAIGRWRDEPPDVAGRDEVLAQIEELAHEVQSFDGYGRLSCSAGRASYRTGCLVRQDARASPTSSPFAIKWPPTLQRERDPRIGTPSESSHTRASHCP